MLRVLFLLGLSGLRTVSSSERLHVQVTVPKKIWSQTIDGYESHASYNIPIEGKTYTVNLTQKILLPHGFRVYSYDGAGIMKPVEQQFQNFCFYQGYVKGYPNSMVMVSTCTGLRGFLQFGNVSYGIEPLESSIGFEHVIYQVEHKKTGVSLYAEKDIELKGLPYKIQSIELQPDFSQYIEMHVVVEKYLYDHMGSDATVVTQKVFQLIGLTNAIFTPFNLTVILSSLELWIDENKIATTGDANELLHRFLKWKRSYLVLRPHDVAFLLVYRETSKYVGATFQGKMCDKNYAGGVAMHPRAVSLESLAVILAQLLSLSMGIAYDDVNKCQCPGTVCIMNSEAIHSRGMKVFSNCSLQDFRHFTSSQKSHCLQNQPRLQPSYKQAAVCGNGQVEEGEVCDCGQDQACTANPPACCDPSTCGLSAGSACSKGDCCDNCQYRNRGYECRASSNECDVTEYCNGSSAACQEDFYVHDGNPCADNEWLCVNGTCMSGEKQCRDLFGQDIHFGTDECFQELNSKTDISGNCGISPAGYTKCGPNDQKCGKLICKYGSDSLLRISTATTIYANISGEICVALEYPQNHADKEKMWVGDGTVCGTGKVCRNKQCVDNAFLNYDCTPANCNNRGVCNNKKHCHCKPSFLPPNCEDSDNTWPGGSVDSGNQRSEAIPERHYIESAYRSKPTRWPLFLIIPFFIILCVLIAMLVKVHFQRKKLRPDNYSSDEQLGSDSESKE